MARCEDCIHYEVCKHHAKILEEDGYEIEFDDTLEVEKRCAAFKPTADVVPKSEIARLQEDVDRLQEINNRQVENIKLAKAEVASEILEKIESVMFDRFSNIMLGEDIRLCIAELKKKYTEGEPNGSKQ